MSPNRVVAVLTPLVFAPAAGGVATWIANNIPGASIPASKLEEVFIGGALIALAPAAQWLHGWQKYEARKAEQETAVELANVAAAAPAPAAPEADFVEADLADEVEEFDQVEELDDFGGSGDSDDFDDLEALDDELFADEQLLERES
jgi:hypothetical protein